MLTRCYPRSFTFYLGNPFETRSRARFDSCAPAHFRPLGLPIYFARVPRGSILAAPRAYFLRFQSRTSFL
jgi:hypothetical protein